MFDERKQLIEKRMIEISDQVKIHDQAVISLLKERQALARTLERIAETTDCEAGITRSR